MIKKTEDIKRDAMGRFEHGRRGGPRAGAGRPPGSKNKTTKVLKDMILGALDRLGGEEYLMKLAIENSSAFASLLGKVLPSTIAADESNGGRVKMKMTFERVVVWPDGRREIEGKTPKQLPAPAPASHTLPSEEPIAVDHKEMKNLELRLSVSPAVGA